TLTVTDTNFISASTNVSTGTSSYGSPSSGNLWGVDFALVPVIGSPVIAIEPESQIINVEYPPATFTMTALSHNPLSYQWQFQASGNSYWTNLSDGASYSGSQSA